MLARCLGGAVVLSCAVTALGQTVTDPNLQVDSVLTTGLSQPIAMRFLGDTTNDFFVIEKATGRVKRYLNGTQTIPLDLQVNSASERGLLGIALPPGFDPTGQDTNNNKVYLYYSRGDNVNDAGAWVENRLSQFNWNGTTLSGETVLRVFGGVADGGGGPNHDGGPIAFGPDGMLYGITGDLNRSGAEQNNGTTSSAVGGIYRLNPDGTNAAGNPFESHANSAFHKWYAYGVRNSFGFDFDPANGNLWDTENGPNTMDEVNLVAPGFNSGWTDIMGPVSLDTGTNTLTHLAPGAVSTYSDPEFTWVDTNAPTSIHFLHGSNLAPGYDNKVLVGDNNASQLYLFTLNAARDGFVLTGLLSDLVANDNAERDLLRFGQNYGAITDISRGPDGYVYIVSLTNGDIYRLLPDTIAGDFDGDNDVDATDIDLLCHLIESNDDFANLNGDAAVSQDDMDYMVATILGTTYGDADLDQDVDGADFDAWRIRDSLGYPIGWATGDFDCDGDVDGADFDLWRLRPASIPGGASVVPEPATWVLALMALAAISRSRRRRGQSLTHRRQ